MNKASAFPRGGKSGSVRSYRRHSPRPDERSFQVVVEQSDLWITVRAGCGPWIEALALDLVREARAAVAAWMLLDPAFGPSLVPLEVPEQAPEIIGRMCRAGAVAGVGPMAAVAGAVAEHVARGLARHSPDCIVENGGDSMLYSTRERLVALLPDPGRKAALGLRLEAGAFPLSLCASSARFGHSLSFGQGDLAVARSKNACLADAAATAFCNLLRQAPSEQDELWELAEKLKPAGLEGLFVQCGDQIGVWGNMELAAL